MKKIGQILKEARLGKNYTLLQLEDITKIRSSFIEKIEKENWDTLPAFPTVLGFVKSLASALSLNEAMAAAVLKRDYPPKKIRIAPKPDLKNKFSWSPKLTFGIGVSVVLIILSGYLINQYMRFVSPPRLTVESPKEGQTVERGTVTVFGTTDSDAKIVINNQPVEVSSDGKYSVNLDVVTDTHDITVTASSRSGKITTVSRRIVVQ